LSDFDTLDRSVLHEIISELVNGSDFKLMIANIIGIDSAGQKHGIYHKELERSIIDTNEIIHAIVDRMDHHTTLMILGDRGMTDNGDHGGASEAELRTVLFAH